MTGARVAGFVVAALAMLVGTVAVIGYAEATRDPVVVRYAIGFTNWPAATPPIRAVQLSDLHVSWPDMPVARLERIVDQVNALQPDLILLTGDYSAGKIKDFDIGNLDVMTAPLKRLRARHGVVAVRGNHDQPYWSPIVFRRIGIPLLDNRWVAAGPVTIAGVDDLITARSDARAAIRGAPADRPLILLSHNPEVAQWMPRRVDLLVAGHTHGGQIDLPVVGRLATLSPYLDAHWRGVFFEGPRRMVVSSGIGTTLVPFRLGVPPETVLMTWGPATR